MNEMGVSEDETIGDIVASLTEPKNIISSVLGRGGASGGRDSRLHTRPIGRTTPSH